MTNKIIKQLKEENQDFEWYPTTTEIINALYQDLKDLGYFSLLDIGAGNGKIFKVLEKINTKERFQINKYAIEKSQILINQMDKDIFIVGTDFMQQSLLDKKVDVIFCNPPYSEFKQWVNKILNESFSKRVYMVIPERWIDDKETLKILENRNMKYTIIDSFTFENSEDRKARAKVNLIKFESKYDNYYNRNDPFENWFNNHFKFSAEKEEVRDWEVNQKKREELNQLALKKDFINNLVDRYNAELENLISNYRKVGELDSDILKELNVNVKGLCEALKLKIENLKNLYWKSLFNNLDDITKRLTSKSRESLMNTLFNHTSIDFSVSNIYAIIIWSIKNVNEYLDKQLLEIYMELSDRDNVRLYKSNHRIIEDGWRYNKKEMSHYSLDYRIIKNGYSCFDFDWSGNLKGLTSEAKNLIFDIFTIANNLGFTVIHKNRTWAVGKREEFYDSEGNLFCDIKCYKNGNIHFRFNQDFMKAFNIEASRLNKWIKTPKEAVEEFDINIEEAEKFFGSNYVLLKSNVKLLEEK
jgi:hypothetical protein